MGLGVGSQVERGFSCERKGPLKAWVMALRLKAQTADAAMLLLCREGNRGDNIFLILIPRTVHKVITSGVSENSSMQLCEEVNLQWVSSS